MPTRPPIPFLAAVAIVAFAGNLLSNAARASFVQGEDAGPSFQAHGRSNLFFDEPFPEPPVTSIDGTVDVTRCIGGHPPCPLSLFPPLRHPPAMPKLLPVVHSSLKRSERMKNHGISATIGAGSGRGRLVICSGRFAGLMRAKENANLLVLRVFHHTSSFTRLFEH